MRETLIYNRMYDGKHESWGKCALSESWWFLVTKGEKNVEVKTMDFVKEDCSKYRIGR